jgi:hypothetical protein
VATQNSGCAAFSLLPNTRDAIQNQMLTAKPFAEMWGVFQQAAREIMGVAAGCQSLNEPAMQTSCAVGCVSSKQTHPL